MVGRAVDVHDESGAGLGLEAGRAGLEPDVLADVDAYGGAVNFEDWGVGAGEEVALFVEDAVVGKVDLVVDAEEASVPDDGCGVEEAAPVVRVNEPDDDRYALRVVDDLIEASAVLGDEVGFVEQVLGWVAGDGELREGDEVGTAGSGLVDVVEGLGRVAPQVADSGVYLGEGCSECSHGATGQVGRPLAVEYSTGVGRLNGIMSNRLDHPTVSI